MKFHLSRDRCLQEDLLSLYERCRREGCPTAAEHVMQALEELARDRPAAQEAVDRAYLMALGGGGSRMSRGV